jgi:hypothetical protein
MDDAVRNDQHSIPKNELRYVIAILLDDSIQRQLSSGMYKISQELGLVTYILDNGRPFVIDNVSAPALCASLFSTTRALLFLGCNLVWQMVNKKKRDIEGGPFNPDFEIIHTLLPGEPNSDLDTNVMHEYFRLQVEEEKEWIIELAATLRDVWQYHWFLTQKTLRELAFTVNHMIPHDILETANGHVDTLSSIFLVSSYIEVFDQLCIEQYMAGRGDSSFPIVSAFGRESFNDDKYTICERIISSLATYLETIADNKSVYIVMELTEEDKYLMDSLNEELVISEDHVAAWLVERFLNPLQFQLLTWPLCMIFVREFREMMTAKQIILQSLRMRILSPCFAIALSKSDDTTISSKWKDRITAVEKTQRAVAADVLERTDVSTPKYVATLDAIQATLVVASVNATRTSERTTIEKLSLTFNDLKEYAVRLRAVLLDVAESYTVNAIQGGENRVTDLDDWISKAFWGESLAERDRCAALCVLASRGRKGYDALSEDALDHVLFLDQPSSEIPRISDIVNRYVSMMRPLVKKIGMVMVPIVQGLGVSPMDMSKRHITEALLVAKQCREDDETVCMDIVGHHLLWLGQLSNCTFPEPNEVCTQIFQSIATSITKAPFHLRALLDRDAESIAAAVTHADILGASGLNTFAEVAEITDKIPDAAQGNPWHGWSIISSGIPIDDSSIGTVSAPSVTAQSQIAAAGIYDEKIISKGREHGDTRLLAGTFAMPNIGLMSSLREELQIQEITKKISSRNLLLTYALLEFGWAIGRPLNDTKPKFREVQTAMMVASQALQSPYITQYKESDMEAIDWIVFYQFALAIGTLGPCASATITTCIANRYSHLLDKITIPYTDDDPYLTTAMRVMISDSPYEIQPPTVGNRRSRNDLSLVVAVRMMQTISYKEFENLRLNTSYYYRTEHPFYVASDAVIGRYSFLQDREAANRDIAETLKYATPQ